MAAKILTNIYLIFQYSKYWTDRYSQNYFYFHYLYRICRFENCSILPIARKDTTPPNLACTPLQAVFAYLFGFFICLNRTFCILLWKDKISYPRDIIVLTPNKMKRFLLTFVLFSLLGTAYIYAQTTENNNDKNNSTLSTDEQKQVTKQGWNFAPFPSIGYNSDPASRLVLFVRFSTMAMARHTRHTSINLMLIYRGARVSRLCSTSSTTRSTLFPTYA